MIDAGIAASVMVKSQERSAESTMRLAKAYTAGEKLRNLPADKAEAVAKDFEAMFISQMLEQMFGDSLGSELFGNEESSDLYRGMMVESYGKQIVKSGGLGIAEYVKKELLKLQEI